MKRKFIAVIVFGGLLCSALGQTWNSPYKDKTTQNIRYGAFNETPKTLDPARAYSANEIQFIAQIYEPPLQYHYLKRPFTLTPLTATEMPTVTYYNEKGQKLPANISPSKVAYSIYDIYIQPNIFYQPHPAFAKDNNGNYRYHKLLANDLEDINTLGNFKYTGTRELTADDYVYQIKRLAHPKLSSPIFGIMSNHIVGLKEYAQNLQTIYEKLITSGNETPFIDLRKHPFLGATVINRYHYQIKIKGVYPQFKYWLAMPFFAPVPWEADYFYSQPGMLDNNIVFDWYPVGTGPYYLTENNPNKEIILKRNPNFRGEKYPAEGAPGDKEKSYLDDAGKPMPFIDLFVFTLDKESIPRWNKFLQGYYDESGVSADSFDQAIRIDNNGNPYLTESLKKKGIRLRTSINPAIFYIGFNMLDQTVGGYSEQKKKLRQAIAIAINYEEFISIFLSGRGIPAQGPIAPSIFGYQTGEKGMNPIIYDWVNGKKVRKPLAYAKKLLVEAGYPGGRNPKTGKPLILNFDVATTASPDDSARFNWMRKQFAKLGIDLNIRATLYNRFQENVRNGNVQIFSWGWLADYPDPENFLFLLYGPNGKVKQGGENATNYSNAEFDKLFEEVRYMPDGPERQKKINELLKIIREDSPWIMGFHPIDFVLSHVWNHPGKLNSIANNTFKYEKLNPQLRAELRKQWNKPIIWPLFLVLAFIVLMFIPLTITYIRRENKPSVKRGKRIEDRG